MQPWKAPGPDGFPAGFYQKSWDTVGNSVYRFVDEVWHNPSQIADVNHTDICLIPKVSNPEYVKQFRPISPCNTIYKIVSKIIVERLKVCLPSIISPYQTGFVPGRNIHENIIVAKEMAHTMHRMKGKKGAFAIKVDLAKAYDKISWEFIWRILVEIKLPNDLINIIMHSVSSVMTNVKWNGTRDEYFRPQRGIRQGDPISPYLFVLCMDKLSHIILQDLMFADDLLLFGEASEGQMRCVLDTLQKFCGMSGQEVSQEKTSVMFSGNVERSLRTKLLSMSGFLETNSFGKYLGVPLHGRAPKKSDFQYLLDQVSSKLSMWKASQLSFAGRVTLAKSVVEAMPVYPMMSSLIPKSCLEDIQKMQGRFIWGDTENKRKFHAIGWDRITAPKDKGGLGLRKLGTMNKACLLKLNWKLKENSDDLWCKVLREKYDLANSMTSSSSKATSSSLWKTLHNLQPMIDKLVVWSVGNGRRIKAWSEAWIEAGLLLEDFANIPENLRNMTVYDLVDNEGKWNLELLAEMFPYEIMMKIAAIVPPMDDYGNDEIIGIGSNKCGFSVTSI
jgi:hypothetical protein